MGFYQLSFHEDRDLLAIYLEGAFTVKEMLDCRESLTGFVAGLTVKTVFIDRTNAEIPQETVDLIQEISQIPELQKVEAWQEYK